MTEQINSASSIAHSPIPADDRRAQLAALVPDAFSEGKLDVAALKRALGEEAVIEGFERYALTWAGKANAYKVLQELTTPVETLDVAGGKVFAIHQRKMLFVLESFTDAMIQPLVELKPREIIAIDGVFHDSDTLKTNLDLQCRDAGIKFTCL